MPASSSGIIGHGGPSDDREPARKLVEDSADASLVHPRPLRRSRPSGGRASSAGRPRDGPAGRRRRIRSQNSRPCASWLGRACAASPQRLGGGLVQGVLPLQGPPVLLVAVGEPSPGDPAEEGLQLRSTGEMPAAVADAANQVGEHRLDDVCRINLGPQARAEPPPDRDPKIRLIGQEDALHRLDVALDSGVRSIDPAIRDSWWVPRDHRDVQRRLFITKLRNAATAAAACVDRRRHLRATSRRRDGERDRQKIRIIAGPDAPSARAP